MGRFINADAFTSTGQGLLGNNMFAYCGNNPVIASDPNGNWFIVVIGGITGAVVSGITTAIQGGSQKEILLSALCGALSGAFAATGAGGLLGQIVAGAVLSAVDSGFQNYNRYTAGKTTKRDAVIGTLVDTALGATFGAMGFEGNKALKTSNTVSNKTVTALKTLSKEGLHPVVKNTANKAVRAGGRYIISAAKQAFLDNIITSAASVGIGSTAELLY